jgi:hypothetical protein
MERFIVRFTGKGEPPAEDINQIRKMPQLRVVDSSPRMLLVDAPHAELDALIRSMPSWVLSPEKFFPIPDPRPKLRK